MEDVQGADAGVCSYEIRAHELDIACDGNDSSMKEISFQQS